MRAGADRPGRGSQDENIGMEYYRPAEAKVLRARSGHSAPIGIARVRGVADGKPLDPYVAEDAFLFVLGRTRCDAELSCDNRRYSVGEETRGTLRGYDYRRNWTCLMLRNYEIFNWHIPRAAVESLEADKPGSVFNELTITPGRSVHDPVAWQLAGLVEPALHRPQDVSTLFVDHICQAAVAHFARTYGAYKPLMPRSGARLSPRQEQLVKDMIQASLNGDVRLADLAMACGLSISHFSRAFRGTMGMPPHRWLLSQRVERAKALLAGSRRTIAEIALDVGFFDQSHFTRVFTRSVGTSPMLWRRSRM